VKNLVSTLLFGVILTAASASADTFNFSFDFPANGPGGSADSGSGTLTANPLGGDEYQVTSISGTTSLWGAITGLDPVNTYEGNDNLLYYPTQPYVDSLGVSFTVVGLGDSGTHQVNLYLQGSAPDGYTECEFNVGQGTLDVVAAPEPASVALVVFGILGCCFLGRRRATMGLFHKA
jgi:hypothetical protein